MSLGKIPTIVSVVACLILMVTSEHGIDSSCAPESVQVQQDFDINRYLGKWYITERYPRTTRNPENTYSNHQHTYLDAGNGQYDVFSRGRQAGICTYPKGKLIIPSTSGTSGKLRYRLSSGRVLNYWVLNTDYDKYAVVFGYQESLPNQQSRDDFSWILVRPGKTAIGEAENNVINKKLSEVCIQRNQFRSINQEKPECRQCDPSTWTVQPNFDMDRYLGKWNDILFHQSFELLSRVVFNDFSVTYTKQANGTVSATVIARNPVDNQCIVSENDSVLKETGVPGKLLRINQTSIPEDYWVIETDYTGYAFVFVCDRKTATIQVPCPSPRSFICIRKLAIDSFQLVRLVKLFDQYCINVDDYFTVIQDNPCPADPKGSGKIEVCIKYDKADVQINEHA